MLLRIKIVPLISSFATSIVQFSGKNKHASADEADSVISRVEKTIQTAVAVQPFETTW